MNTERIFLAVVVFLLLCLALSIMLHKKESSPFGYKQMNGPHLYGCKKSGRIA